MYNAVEYAKAQVKEMIMGALGRLVSYGKIPTEPLPPFQVTIPADNSHGDFSANTALVSAKALKSNPRAIAQMIADSVEFAGTDFSKVEVAGPGFLNFFIGESWFEGVVRNAVAMGDDYGKTDLGKGKRVLVEVVSANPTGPMHIGNARGGALGDSLSSLLQEAGYEVSREFYINDAGNLVAKFGKSLDLRYMQLCSEAGQKIIAECDAREKSESDAAARAAEEGNAAALAALETQRSQAAEAMTAAAKDHEAEWCAALVQRTLGGEAAQ